MTNEVTPATKAGDDEQIDSAKIATETITELSEDMEMVSPGAMLREARKALSFSQDHIANKLNLKVTLIQNIENDAFDPSMPVTFNRGYLSNYAKLVAVDVEDVLASYDALDAASIQRSEMLSFSKETSKQAEHSRVMWLSYFIVAVLVGLTVLWWQQESSQLTENSVNDVVANINKAVDSDSAQEQDKVNLKLETTGDTPEPIIQSVTTAEEVNQSVSSTTNEQVSTEDKLITTVESTQGNEVIPAQEAALSTAVFTFKGDCWVNIYDATGERIAWGVKKAGYVMTIQGKAPLRITVGKPELTSIVFNDQAVDMSIFDTGNIAKFNLPIIVE